MDKATKVLLLALALVVGIAVLWKGLPVNFVLAGPDTSARAIPVEVNMRTAGYDRFQSQTMMDGRGNLYITRLDKQSGNLDVFRIDEQGRLIHLDQK